MTNLVPAAELTPVIQLETTDRNLAGPYGPLNFQAQALLNRTEYLKNQIAGLQVEIDSLSPGAANALRTELGYASGAGLVGAHLLDDSYVTVQEAIDYRVDANKIFTLGAGGMFTSMRAALDRCSRIGNPVYKNGGVTVEIKCLAGYELDEQIIVDNVDLGFVLITSTDPVVRINHTIIAASPALTPADFTTPAFGARNFGTLPIIGALFSYDANTLGCDGVAVHYNSKVRFMPGAGILNCRRGLQALYTSDATCYAPGLSQGEAGSGAGLVAGVKFPGTLFRACHIAFNSTCGLARSDFSGCQSTGETVYGIWGSTLDIYQSNMSNSAGEAVYIRDGSVCNARETNVSGSVIGYHALHGGSINARSRAVTDGNPWIGNGAKNCTQYGVLASYCSRVEAANLDVSGSRIGLNASNGSTINFTEGFAQNCIVTAVNATDASTISALSANVDGSATGFYSELASTINASGTSALLCTLRAFYANSASTMCIEGGAASVTGAGAMEVVFATRGARIDARGKVVSGGTHGFRAFEDGRINAYSATSTGASAFGFAVERGSIIAAGSSTGLTNVTVNTISASGIIFK